MIAKDFLKEIGIHPTEPIYWDLENKTIQLDELLEIFAEAKAKEAYNQGVRDASESAKTAGTDWCGVDKQSILKLLK